MEIKIKMQIKEKNINTLNKIRQCLSEYRHKLDKQVSKIRISRYIYKLFNEPYSDKNGKEYFKGISHLYNLFEEELNTNTIFNETFYSKYDKNNVIDFYVGNNNCEYYR